jgi:hypothetical protein
MLSDGRVGRVQEILEQIRVFHGPRRQPGNAVLNFQTCPAISLGVAHKAGRVPACLVCYIKHSYKDISNPRSEHVFSQ